ncbi:HpcH/HpaI aldolase/citrate lyase family protein [Amycolatopsis sp. NPDC059021]|uniref:HpcH/HpaI aldolase family protein n=1 Tax=Amycolatopsis sp. NPDC059021 TaxID=3346704 RepID=UPI00366AD869
MNLRSRIIGRAPLAGLIVKMPAHSVVELAGHTGFDFVLLDTEHGSADTGELEQHLRAADAAGIPVLVRVAATDPAAILRALDAGAAGIVVPHVSTAEAAEAAVRAAHYPPRGVRGLAVSTRAGRYGSTSLADHLAKASRETVVVVQAEDVEAARNCGAIAATAGVDAVWIGPTDLSLSLGVPGQLRHPTYLETVRHITAAVAAAPECALCALVGDAEAAAEWRAQGASVLLFNHSTLLADSLRNAVRIRENGAGRIPHDE